MTKDEIMKHMREKGKSDALALREKAVAGEIDDTAIIDNEEAVPDWSAEKDCTAVPAGSPFAHEGQVYRLLQPHNAAHYPTSTPVNTPALWGLAHTKNPAKAKPYVAPLGTSGLYMLDECCIFDGKIWRCIVDSNPYSPADYAANWVEVTE